jgi:ribonucleoside-triphosphate reductase
VEALIRKSGIKVVTAPLIREMVNARLIEKGLENARKCTPGSVCPSTTSTT